MDLKDRAKLLRSLEIFLSVPDERLSALAGLLETVSLGDGEAVIAEGAKSDGLYCVVSGRVRVTKRLEGGGEKDLAILGPGEFLGEMELLRGSTRSAGARAQGKAELLRLKSAALTGWLEQDAASAARFYAGLAELQAARLRRTSDEVALLSDLSQLLVSGQHGAAELLSRALERLTPHLQGEWSAEARAYNLFENEMALVSRAGAAITPDAPLPAGPEGGEAAWPDDRTLVLPLRSPKRPLGMLTFRSARRLSDAQRAETARILGPAARLLASALENIDYRVDEALRERLRSRSHGASL